ncbi:MAG: DUF1573 domain-containing protein, partial [Thermomicrobiales bacterium]
MDDRIELDRVLCTVHHGSVDNAPPKVFAQIRVTFGPAADGREGGIPTWAEHRVSQFFDDPAICGWGYTRITLQSVAHDVPVDQLLDVSPHPQASIADERYRLGYDLGARTIFVDGRILNTHEPLHGDIGDQLEWWVEHGTWAAPEVAEVKETVAPQLSKQPKASEVAPGTFAFDFGEIAIDAGPQVLSHKFLIENDGNKPFDVLDLKRSCGCVEAKIDKTHLLPGDKAAVEMSIKLSNTGRVAQGCTIILSDDRLIRAELSAYGVIGFDFTVICRGNNLPDANGEIPVRVYIVDTLGNGETTLPRVVSPPGVTLSTSEWITLENHADTPDRATRQVSSGVLDVSQYQ